jgi:hypothetical protein
MKHTIDALGQLHDAKVDRIEIAAADGRLRLLLIDLFANFRNEPLYPGEITGEVLFSGISRLDISCVLMHEPLRIYGILVDDPLDGMHPFRIELSPGGLLSGQAKQIQLHPAAEIAQVISRSNETPEIG